MASTGGVLSAHTSHSGRWYIVSCECVNKSTIITFPHHLLQISSASPQIQLQHWTQRGNDSLETLSVTHKVNHLKPDVSFLFCSALGIRSTIVSHLLWNEYLDILGNTLIRLLAKKIHTLIDSTLMERYRSSHLAQQKVNKHISWKVEVFFYDVLNTSNLISTSYEVTITTL